MIFTAYFDEADTHGPAPTVIMAGYIGHAYQWRRFEQKLARLQARDGFRIFHAKDFKARVGEFSGWLKGERQTRVKLIPALAHQHRNQGNPLKHM